MMSISASIPILSNTPIRPSSGPAPAHLLKPAHLQSLSTHFHTELDLLDRIVYKNQSQFRLNVFWRKVAEIRRLGRKVRESWEETRSEGLLDTVGEETKANRELLKRFAILVEKLHLALPKLHNALTLTIELTHFLPTMVVLLGITSRLWAISFILYDHLVCLWDKSFGKGANRKRKGLRKLPEWNHSSIESVHKDSTGSMGTSERATDKDTESITSVLSPFTTTLTTDLPVGSPQSELGEVIKRTSDGPGRPSTYPSGSVALYPGLSETGDEDDIGVYIDGIGEAGEKISRDYFSLPLDSGYSPGAPLIQLAGLDSRSPSPSPLSSITGLASNGSFGAQIEIDANPESGVRDRKKTTDRRKILKNDSSVPLVSSPLSRPISLSPPLPPASSLSASLSSSLQGPSGPSISSPSTKPSNTKHTRRSKTSLEPIHSASKIRSQSQDSSSASSTPVPSSTSITSAKSAKSVKPVIASTTPVTAATAVARTVPTKRKIDLPIGNPSDTLAGKEIKKKKKKKGDEIDDIFG